MAKKPEPPPQPTRWDIFKAATKPRLLGTAEAPDEASAIHKAAVEYKIPASKLIAVQRQ